jgi:ubiquinone/menaquinone biosynthesis C-methylase UbiE
MPIFSETATTKVLFSTDDKPALQAIRDAQFIAWAPYVFQASVILRDKGILHYIESAGTTGRTIDEVAVATTLPLYGTRVLMEAGLGIGLLYRREGRYYLSKTGHIFLNQPMARINTDFMRDVCYPSAADMAESIERGKPEGLKHLGPWTTIYEGLPVLQEPARASWFTFDHFYSDLAFPEILPLVFAAHPAKILDIGANTGKWALSCLAYNTEVHMGLADLDLMLESAKQSVAEAGYSHRVTCHPMNVLDPHQEFPTGYDAIFMSQFLDCFSDEQIVTILNKCHSALPENGRVFINETFWDCQKLEVSAFSLQMASLYFTTIANGNSQMYDSEVYLKLLDQTGFELLRRYNHIGLSHTILELVKKKSNDNR